MRRVTRTIALVSTAVLTTALVPSTIAATTASWPDEEWVHGTVGTSSFACGTDEGYAATAFGRFLSGELLTQDLDSLAALNGVELDRAADGALAVDPPTSIDQGSAPPTATYTNPLNVSLLGGVAGIDLTGLTVGLPVGSAGAVNQYAQVSGYGTAAGASGLVSNSGGVGVTPTTPDADLPEPATVGLSTFLPAAAGITDARLEVGAVAASSTLDWCAALRSALWGDGSVSGVVRDYGIAGLGLEIDSPLIGDLVDDVSTGLPAVQSSIDSLLGTNGLISNSISTALLARLVSGLAVGDVTGTVGLSGLDLAGSVATLLTTPLGDGVVSIDLVNGTISVDLDELLGYDSTSINNLAPNSELVLDDLVVNDLVERVGDLLDDFVTDVVTELTNEIRAATLTVDLGLRVNLLAGLVPLVAVTVDLVAPLGAVIDSTATFTVGATALGAAIVLNPLLSPLGLTLNGLLGIVNALAPFLVSPVANAVGTTAIGAVTTLGSTLSLATAPIVTALSAVVGALPQVLSLMANVQPDQFGAPGDTGFEQADGDSSAQYLVTALRVGIAPVVPGEVASLSFATASAGPVDAP
ncbi:choice-of-anchor G family protein [Herbiconiux liangxiaofengii]|uniref:choice-of-anchor G family protein n=1 Tax=Herbiconiux liangxiaofengii TaxID=3342795 RepID=UPI0035B8347F